MTSEEITSVLDPTHPTNIDDVTELAVLLPSWQVAALESAAHRQGLTMAQLVRKLLAESLPKTPSWQ